MYFLKWDYDDIYPSCSVVYYPEPYYNEKEIIEEKEKVQRLKELCEVFNGIVKKIKENGFSELCPQEYKDPIESYPFYYFAKQKEINNIVDIECSRIVGANWANQPKELRGNYPKPTKLWNLLIAYLNLNEDLKNSKDRIPPIPVYKIMDDYFCDEGNHRLYAARLLGFKTIKAKVFEYDYLTFLEESSICQIGKTYYLLSNKNNSIYCEINNKDVEEYNKIKETLLGIK